MRSLLTNSSLIGQGAFGKVYKVTHVLDGQMYAIKEIQCTETNIDSVLREVRSLASLNHPNIVRYHHSWISTQTCSTAANQITNGKEILAEISTTPENTLYIQTELMDMNVEEYLQTIANNTPENETERLKIYEGIKKAVYYLHTQGIVHCDIKPSNILLKVEDSKIIHVKLTDFGLVQAIGQDHPLLRYYGSEFYMHPHLLHSDHPKPTQETDLYSLAIIGLELKHICETRMETIKKINDIKEEMDTSIHQGKSFTNSIIKL